MHNRTSKLLHTLYFQLIRFITQDTLKTRHWVARFYTVSALVQSLLIHYLLNWFLLERTHVESEQHTSLCVLKKTSKKCPVHRVPKGSLGTRLSNPDIAACFRVTLSCLHGNYSTKSQESVSNSDSDFDLFIMHLKHLKTLINAQVSTAKLATRLG